MINYFEQTITEIEKEVARLPKSQCKHPSYASDEASIAFEYFDSTLNFNVEGLIIVSQLKTKVNIKLKDLVYLKDGNKYWIYDIKESESIFELYYNLKLIAVDASKRKRNAKKLAKDFEKFYDLNS